MKKRILGVRVFQILGIIFFILGILFTILGACMFLTGHEVLTIVGMAFCMPGIMLLIPGVVFLILDLRKKKRISAMVEAGRYVWAEIVDCAPNLHIRVNGRHPFFLVARYTDSRGINHLFKGPSTQMHRDSRLIGKQVKVYYDGDDFRHYYLDAEPILSNYIEH